MGNQRVPQTDHERMRMLPDQSDDLINEQTCQAGSCGFKQNFSCVLVVAQPTDPDDGWERPNGVFSEKVAMVSSNVLGFSGAFSQRNNA